MALLRDRTRFSTNGLGTLRIRETSPSAGTAHDDIGYLEASDIVDEWNEQKYFDETGALVNVLHTNEVTQIKSALLQVGIDELELLKNSTGKLFSLQYFGKNRDSGKFQYYGFDRIRINPSIARGFKAEKQLLPFVATVLDLNEELGYTHPGYYLFEGAAEILIKNLQLWVDPRLAHNVATAVLLEMSGFARHGTITADYATMWQTGTPANFLRFDGTDDSVSFGDVLDDDASTDRIFECWMRVQGADDTQQEVLAKKALISDHTDGFAIFRDSSNKVSFKLSDGAASATVVSTATLLQNVWKHVLVAVDRNGNATIYLNGAVNGTPVSVASVANGSNAGNLYLGRDGTNFGQVDIGGVRIYNLVDGVPTNIATIAANHYAAEKAYYGLT